VAIGDQHERAVALALSVSLAALPGDLDELLDLMRRQVLTLAQVGIDRPQWHCPVLVCWCYQPELGFSLHFAASSGIDCPDNAHKPVNRSVKSGQDRVVIGPSSAALLRVNQQAVRQGD
jgi:hypothetical protein